LSQAIYQYHFNSWFYSSNDLEMPILTASICFSSFLTDDKSSSVEHENEKKNMWNYVNMWSLSIDRTRKDLYIGIYTYYVFSFIFWVLFSFSYFFCLIVVYIIKRIHHVHLWLYGRLMTTNYKIKRFYLCIVILWSSSSCITHVTWL
jgi:hypothetical protein